MQAYLVPFRFGRAAFGDKEGYRLKGPILYAPERGAIFYDSGAMGDSDGFCIVTIGVDFFENEGIFLKQLGRQIRGEKLGPPYEGKEFDLSGGVSEVDIPESEFQKISDGAKTVRDSLERFKEMSLNLISRLE